MLLIHRWTQGSFICVPAVCPDSLARHWIRWRAVLLNYRLTPMMSRLAIRLHVRWVAPGSILAALLVCICGITGVRIADQRALRPAERGAQAAINQLPALEHFTLVAVQDTSFRGREGSCYYGRKWFLLGTSLPAREALHQYTSALHAQGWTAEGEQYPQSRGLIRGQHEYICTGSRWWHGNVI